MKGWPIFIRFVAGVVGGVARVRQAMQAPAGGRLGQFGEERQVPIPMPALNMDLLSTNPDPVVLIAPDSAVRYVNPAFEAMTGFSKEEALASSAPYPWSQDARHVGEKGEMKVRARAGAFRWVRVCPIELALSDGTCFRLEHWVDITREKDFEEALRSSEARFYKAFQYSPLIMSLSGIEGGRFLDVNEAFVRKTGFSRDRAIGKTSVELNFISPQERKRIIARLEAEGVVDRLEIAARRADGSPMILSYSGQSVLIEGQPWLLSSSADITAEREAVAALTRSEALLRQSQSLARMGSWELDLITREVICTDEVYRIFGIEKSGAIPTVGEFLECVQPQDRKAFLRAFSRPRQQSQRERVFQHRICAPHTQAVRSVEHHYRFAFNDEGRPVRLLGLVQDITDRQREKRFRSAQMRLINLSSDHTIQELVDAYLKEAQDLTGSAAGFYRLVDEGEVSMVVQHGNGLPMAPASAGHEPPSANGSSSWADAICTRRAIVRNSDSDSTLEQPSPRKAAPHVRELVVPVSRNGRVVAVLGVSNKPTDYEGEDVKIVERLADLAWETVTRKQKEEESRRLMEAIHQSADAVVITDISGVIVYTNPTFETTSGFSSEEARGQNPRILKSGVHGQGFYEEMWAALSEGRTWSGRIVNRRKDGSLFTEEATISPVRDLNGRTVNYVAVKRDITKEIALEKQLNQVQRLESMGRLAGGIAHDFNNMLAVIQGYSEMALSAVDPGNQIYSDLREIHQAARRSAELTRQVLAFARQQVVEPQVLSLNAAVASMTKMLGRLIGEDIRLVWQPSETEWMIKADPGQIDQILANLCVNARDAIDGSGTITVMTENMRDFEPPQPYLKRGDYVRLTVSDNGKGMDEATVANVFEPFFTTKDAGQGTGLGLATVYGIVLQNQGHILVESEPGTGSTFEILLPRHTAGRVEAPSDRSAVEVPPGKNEVVLIVEDETQVLGLAESILGTLGYRVLSAATPTTAMDLFEKNAGQIDLVITDVVMPEKSGPDLAEDLLLRRPGTRILFMTGHAPEAIARKGLGDKGKSLIRKPFSRRQLALKVREMLDHPEEGGHGHAPG